MKPSINFRRFFAQWNFFFPFRVHAYTTMQNAFGESISFSVNTKQWIECWIRSQHKHLSGEEAKNEKFSLLSSDVLCFYVSMQAEKSFQNKEPNLKDEMPIFSIHNLILSLSPFSFGTVFIQFFVLHLAVNQLLSLYFERKMHRNSF